MTKMTKIAALLMLFTLMTNCEKNKLCNDDELSLQKVDYKGNQLRINGYYFGDVNRNSSKPFANIYYLYNNGIFFTSDASDLDEAEAGTINVDIENSFGKQIKGLWGVFQINDNVIEIERWRSRTNGCETTIYERGDILNDTTFIITKREYREKGTASKTETPNSTFYFRPLDAKPDSTNSFIR